MYEILLFHFIHRIVITGWEIDDIALAFFAFYFHGLFDGQFRIANIRLSLDGRYLRLSCLAFAMAIHTFFDERHTLDSRTVSE